MGHANACTTTIAGHCLNLYTAAIVVTTSFLARKEGSFPKSTIVLLESIAQSILHIGHQN